MSTDTSAYRYFLDEMRRAIPPSASFLLLCVSGGADSMALFHGALRLGLNFQVANCNFHLRGSESDRDSAFVAQACLDHGVKLHRLDFDTQAYCEAHGLSLEMGCRNLRYEAFRKLKQLHGFSRIVVAHNADDNQETLLLNLFRGTGLHGLTAMRPDNGEILRPLLRLPRSAIEAFLSSIGATHITDSSNLSDSFRRNFVRLRLLPLIKERWPGASKALTRTIANLQQAEAIYDYAVGSMLGPSRPQEQQPFTLPFAAIANVGAAGAAALIHEAFAPLGASETQVLEMAATTRKGARWDLPHGSVTVATDAYCYRPFAAGEPSPCPECEVQPLTLTAELMQTIKTNADKYVAYFPGHACDYYFSFPRRADRFSPMGMRGSKLIADMLRDANIDPAERPTVSLLRRKDDADTVVWIPGLRRSARWSVPSTLGAPLIRITVATPNFTPPSPK